MHQRLSRRPDSRTPSTRSQAARQLKAATREVLERLNQACETRPDRQARPVAASEERNAVMAEMNASARRLLTALSESVSRQRRQRGESVIKRRQFVPPPILRTAPRARGAGRPAARRTVTRSSAASGDSGDPDPSTPPSRAGTVARPNRSQGVCRGSEGTGA
jgi:hypothetical protein